MEWATAFLPEQKIVVIKTSGIADETSSLEMAKSIPETMARHKVTRLLIDHSAIRSVSGSTIKIYNRPQELRTLGVPSKVRIAEVVQPAHKEHFGFLETVCCNRGFAFSVFNDYEAAIQWLMK